MTHSYHLICSYYYLVFLHNWPAERGGTDRVGDAPSGLSLAGRDFRNHLAPNIFLLDFQVVCVWRSGFPVNDWSGSLIMVVMKMTIGTMNMKLIIYMWMMMPRQIYVCRSSRKINLTQRALFPDSCDSQTRQNTANCNLWCLVAAFTKHFDGPHNDDDE